MFSGRNLKSNSQNFKILFDSVTKIYYFLSVPIAFLFKPLNYWEYYRQNFLPLFRLINKSFCKSNIFTFFAIWYPLIFTVILPHIIPINPRVPNIHPAQMIVFGIGLMIPTTMGIQVLPTLLVEFKQSSLLKRIGATQIKTWMLTLTFILYFIVVSFVSLFLNLSISFAMYQNRINFGLVNFFQYAISLVICMTVAISVGMSIAGIARTQSGATLIGLIIIIPGGFLCGQFVPFRFVTGWLVWLGYFFPQKWPTMLGVVATTGGNIFTRFQTITKLPDLALLLAWVAPWLFTTVSVWTTIKFFKWHGR